MNARTAPSAAPVNRIMRFRYAGATALLALVLSLAALVILPTWTDDAVSLTGGSEAEQVTLTVASPRVGDTGVEILVTPRRKSCGGCTPDVTVQAVLPAAGHATPATPARATGTHLYGTSVHLMMAGRWVFRVTVDDGAHRTTSEFPLAVSG